LISEIGGGGLYIGSTLFGTETAQKEFFIHNRVLMIFTVTDPLVSLKVRGGDLNPCSLISVRAVEHDFLTTAYFLRPQEMPRNLSQGVWEASRSKLSELCADEATVKPSRKRGWLP